MNEQPTIAYAAYSLDTAERLASSSGGMCGLFAKHILDAGGVVFAVCWDENFEAAHRKIETAADLPLTYGSKYVQSRLGDTFRSVRDSLQKGTAVLFVGTPCQTEGLRVFLGREYDNLYLLDLICYGVPSRAAWRKYLADHQLKDNLSFLNMRDKSSGWSRLSYSWATVTKDGKRLCVPPSQVSFIKGFFSNIYLRPSCCECRFKGVERKSDITLGDFWGVWDELPEMDDNRGTSAVLIHTEKGKALFEAVKDAICCREVSVDTIVKHNSRVVSSTKGSKNRKKFFRGLSAGADFDTLVEQCCKATLADKVIGKGKHILRKIFRG